MKNLKLTGLAAIAAMALTAFLGAGTASATELYKYTTPSANDSPGVGMTFTITAVGSTTFEDTEENSLVETCTTADMHGEIDDYVGGHPTGTVDTFTLGNCSHTTDVVSKGSLEIRHIAGTTNGTVVWRGARWTTQLTIFGISCFADTGVGTAIGTVIGAKSPTGHATIDINAILPMGFFCGGDARMTGTYNITTPTGLTVEAS